MTNDVCPVQCEIYDVKSVILQVIRRTGRDIWVMAMYRNVVHRIFSELMGKCCSSLLSVLFFNTTIAVPYTVMSHSTVKRQYYSFLAIYNFNIPTFVIVIALKYICFLWTPTDYPSPNGSQHSLRLRTVPAQETSAAQFDWASPPEDAEDSNEPRNLRELPLHMGLKRAVWYKYIISLHKCTSVNLYMFTLPKFSCILNTSSQKFQTELSIETFSFRKLNRNRACFSLTLFQAGATDENSSCF